MSNDRKVTIAHIQTNELESTVVKIEVAHFKLCEAYMLTGHIQEGVGSGMVRVPLSTIHSEQIEPAARYSEKKLKTLAAGFTADDQRVIALAEKIAKSGKVTIKQPEPTAIDVTV